MTTATVTIRNCKKEQNQDRYKVQVTFSNGPMPDHFPDWLERNKNTQHMTGVEPLLRFQCLY